MENYGYNGIILDDIQNSYCGYKPIEDVGYLVQIMISLFGVDVLSSWINHLTLEALTNVNFSPKLR